MQRHSFAASLVLAVAVVLVLAGPTLAGEQIPFKGILEGDVTHALVDPRTDSVVVDATGTATLLGQFEVIVPHLVDLPSRTAAGHYEFTAANGDTVIAEFHGIAMPTDVPGVLYIEEIATVIGGTGRFAGATGSFVVERLYDRIAGTTVGSFEGTISTPGS